MESTLKNPPEGDLVLLGHFEGLFFTHQQIGLSEDEPFPEDNSHYLNVYKGTFSDAVTEPKFRPEQYQKLGSCTLVSVPNILVMPTKDGVVSTQKTHVFTHLLFIEPRVIKTYPLNGKTYGVISSRAYGVTFKNGNPDQTGNSGGGGNDGGNGPGGGGLGPDGGGLGSGGGNNGNGGNRFWDWISNLFSGCLGNIRRLLWYLFLLFLLLALIRGCHCNTDYCAERDRLALEKKKEEALRDSIREEYKKNLDQALSSIAIIYFYRNSDEINLNSLGNNSPIERLYKVIDAYDEYNFVIEGHHSGLSVESKPNLDIMRAETLRSKLIDMGIDKKRLSSLGKGDKELLDSSGKLSTFYVSPGTVKEYNRNMRARVKYVLKP